jgi:endonuclease/exonuclease/phosphatase (EEP) superfamily protein YafD
VRRVPALSRRAQDPKPLTHVEAAGTWLFIVLGSTPLLASLLGVAWPFELASHFVVHAALGLLVYALLLLMRRRRGPALVALLASVAHAALCAPLLVHAEGEGKAKRLRMVSANLNADNEELALFTAWLRRVDPEIVILLELTARLRAELDGALARYPHRLEHTREDNFGIGVYSRTSPLEALPVLDVWPPMIAARAERYGAPFTLLAIHTAPPITEAMAAERDRQLRWIASFTKREPARLIVAGDLNATSFSPAFQRLLQDSPLTDTRRGFGLHGTWPNAWPSFLRIAIDHVLVTPDIHTRQREVGPDIGSDHRPVFVELEL